MVLCWNFHSWANLVKSVLEYCGPLSFTISAIHVVQNGTRLLWSLILQWYQLTDLVQCNYCRSPPLLSSFSPPTAKRSCPIFDQGVSRILCVISGSFCCLANRSLHTSQRWTWSLVCLTMPSQKKHIASSAYTGIRTKVAAMTLAIIWGLMEVGKITFIPLNKTPSWTVNFFCSSSIHGCRRELPLWSVANLSLLYSCDFAMQHV